MKRSTVRTAAIIGIIAILLGAILPSIAGGW